VNSLGLGMVDVSEGKVKNKGGGTAVLGGGSGRGLLFRA